MWHDYNLYQYTHKIVDTIYGAFFENDAMNAWRFPSRVRVRAKDMPTYNIHFVV